MGEIKERIKEFYRIIVTLYFVTSCNMGQLRVDGRLG